MRLESVLGEKTNCFKVTVGADGNTDDDDDNRTYTKVLWWCNSDATLICRVFTWYFKYYFGIIRINVQTMMLPKKRHDIANCGSSWFGTFMKLEKQ